VLHESEDLDRLVAVALRRREVLGLEQYELAVQLVALDDLVVRDRLLLLLAHLLVADSRSVLLVHEVELEIVLVDRRVHPHRRVDEAERDASRPDGPGRGRAAHAFRLPCSRHAFRLPVSSGLKTSFEPLAAGTGTPTTEATQGG
jgi:hypothetical protein